MFCDYCHYNIKSEESTDGFCNKGIERSSRLLNKSRLLYAYTDSLILLSAPFSSLDTWACEMPISLATSIWVLP